MTARIVGNGWDALADARLAPLPRVSVVVAHYDQPLQLARTLAALARQDYPADLLEVIVADDGSPQSPVVPPQVRLVRQEDEGFRLAAVRNLGAREATGDVLCFLDADTTPEPGYVRALTRLPALAEEAVVVGRRRHADLGGVAVDAPIEEVGPASALPEPAWLAEAYARSRNLLDADDRSYRYVIGAVIACRRALFDELGGFDETFTAYGGEDWEWAHRAWQAGAVLAHEPAAVAWHDGPDWAGRSEDDRMRRANAQALLLADRIPLAGSRGLALRGREPDLVITLDGEPGAGATFVCVDALLAVFPHAQVRVPDPSAVTAFAPDPRVGGRGGPDVDARAQLNLTHPVILDRSGAAALRERIARLGTGVEGSFVLVADGRPIGVAVARRAMRRRERRGDDSGFRRGEPFETGLHVLRAEPPVEAYVGGWVTLDALTGVDAD